MRRRGFQERTIRQNIQYQVEVVEDNKGAGRGQKGVRRNGKNRKKGKE